MEPPPPPKKKNREETLPPIRVTAAEHALIRERAAELTGGNVSELVRKSALGESVTA